MPGVVHGVGAGVCVAVGVGTGVTTATGGDPGRVATAGGAAPGAVAVAVVAGAACDAPWMRFRSFTLRLSSATRAASSWRCRSVESRSSALPGADGGVAPPLLSFSLSGLVWAVCVLSSTEAVTLPPLRRWFGSASGALPSVEVARRSR